MTSTLPTANTPSNAAQTANAASTSAHGTTSPLIAGGAQPTAKSYASATKKSVSPPAIASSTPQVAVGGAQHAKSSSVSPVNGKGPIQPAVPAVANGAAQNSHNRKPSSMTISAAGTSGSLPNGGPVGPNSRPNISFGSINAGGSPAIANSTPHAPQNNTLPAPTANPRITSPATSPSPIPQPLASGGRPPSNLQGQGNGLSFGSMGGENGGTNVRPVSMPPVPPMPQAQHLRRESSQSAHSDVSNANMNRQFIPQGGRGRGYNPAYGMPSPGAQFRQPMNQSRGPMPGQFSNQGPMGSPYRQARSPALTPAAMHQQAQFANQPQMAHGAYPGYPQTFQPNGFYGMQPQHLDPSAYPYFQAPYGMHAGMPFAGAPPSPRPMNHTPHAQPPYMPGQYGSAPHAQGMSRQSSQVSERPPSTIAQPQTPSMSAASQVSHTPTQSSSSPAPTNPAFTIPARAKSKGIVIKNPDGEVVTFDNKKAASPAPVPSKSPVVVSSTPTPPPRAPSAADSQHSRSESKSVKTAAEKKAEFFEQFQKNLGNAGEAEKKAEETKAAKEKEEADAKAAKEKEEADAKAAKEKEEADAKAAKEKAEAEAQAAKEKQEAEAKAAKEQEEEAERQKAETAAKEAESAAKEAESKANETAEKERLAKEEDERIEREIAEMEEQERLEEEREKAFQEKRKKEKEEQASKEKETAANADAEMKRLEREAEERELAKERGESTDDKDAKEKAEAAKLFASLKKPTFGPAVTGEVSEDAAPAHDTSMPPPSVPASKSPITAAAKPKPAALKLETSKPVEPPAPTPGMQSLKSARFLQIQGEANYPAGIKSPNPALNQGAKSKGRQYDKDFLLQFQDVFKEKPSVDWDNKIRETVGDGSESARPQSARTPSSMGGRSGSSRGLPGPSNLGPMGSFTGPGGRTLPAGTSSAERFAMSSGSAPRPPAPGGIGSFGRGGFPMGSSGGPGSRASFPGMPPSGSRQGSGRGGKNDSRRGNTRGGGRRDDEQSAKNMPLTAGMDLKPLMKSQTGWVPTSLTQPAAAAAPVSGVFGPELVQRKVKAALNKMTPEKFDKIAVQILDIAKQSETESDGRTLRQVIQLTFEKACDEAHWASMYAKFCQHMLTNITPAVKDENVRDKTGNPVVGGNLFRKYLLNRCQEEFEHGWENNLPPKPEGENEEAAMLSDEYYIAAAAKRKGLGLIQFIGELYKLGMLTIRIMHECVMRLLNFEGMPDESNVESLVKLLRTVGATMEEQPNGAKMMDAYFQRIDAVMQMPGLPSRMHFMLLDTTELRRKGWRSKDTDKGPKTIQQIREEAAAAQQAAELERMRGGRGGGGGGGRPPQGRGDIRSFSGGGPMPPPDYNRNTLDSSDLKRLSKNASGRTASSGTSSFGPSSMFTSRTGSGRRNLGPGGVSMSRDDSGNSSRTGTPPVKDKESNHHVNSFSALAALENADEAHADTHSPPQDKTDAKAPAAEKKEGADAPAPA